MSSSQPRSFRPGCHLLDFSLAFVHSILGPTDFHVSRPSQSKRFVSDGAWAGGLLTCRIVDPLGGRLAVLRVRPVDELDGAYHQFGDREIKRTSLPAAVGQPFGDQAIVFALASLGAVFAEIRDRARRS